MAPSASSPPKKTSRPPSPTALNRLSSQTAYDLLQACLPDSTYASRMQQSRPFDSMDSILETSRATWNSLPDSKWLAAFRMHEPLARTPEGSDLLTKWARKERTVVRHAESKVRREIRDLEERYLKRHGFPFVMCVEGKMAEEVRDELKERLRNETDQEVYEAAGEQIRITELRLEKALAEAKNL